MTFLGNGSSVTFLQSSQKQDDSSNDSRKHPTFVPGSPGSPGSPWGPRKPGSPWKNKKTQILLIIPQGTSGGLHPLLMSAKHIDKMHGQIYSKRQACADTLGVMQNSPTHTSTAFQRLVILCPGCTLSYDSPSGFTDVRTELVSSSRRDVLLECENQALWFHLHVFL